MPLKPSRRSDRRSFAETDISVVGSAERRKIVWISAVAAIIVATLLAAGVPSPAPASQVLTSCVGKGSASSAPVLRFSGSWTFQYTSFDADGNPRLTGNTTGRYALPRGGARYKLTARGARAFGERGYQVTFYPNRAPSLGTVRVIQDGNLLSNARISGVVELFLVPSGSSVIVRWIPRGPFGLNPRVPASVRVQRSYPASHFCRKTVDLAMNGSTTFEHECLGSDDCLSGTLQYSLRITLAYFSPRG